MSRRHAAAVGRVGFISPTVTSPYRLSGYGLRPNPTYLLRVDGSAVNRASVMRGLRSGSAP